MGWRARWPGVCTGGDGGGCGSIGVGRITEVDWTVGCFEDEVEK